MKVLSLRCAHDHRFEGWFDSEVAFVEQSRAGQLVCPLCADAHVQRLPSAPRLNLRGKSSSPGNAGHMQEEEPQKNSAIGRSGLNVLNPVPTDVQLQALWLQAVQHVMTNTHDVGERFPEEARRIHYGEQPHRPIRGQASPDEVAALRDEGIELMCLPIPAVLKETVQ